jgi:hypothetical protein
VFVWIFIVEAAMDLTSLGARARVGASIKLSPYMRFSINSLLLGVMLVPAGVSVCIMRSRRLMSLKICASSLSVSNGLRGSY